MMIDDRSLRGPGEIGPEAGAQWPLTRNTRNRRARVDRGVSRSIMSPVTAGAPTTHSQSSVFSRKCTKMIKLLKRLSTASAIRVNNTTRHYLNSVMFEVVLNIVVWGQLDYGIKLFLRL